MDPQAAFHYLGSDQFKDLRQKNQFYIDKSLFIKEVFEHAGWVQLILRPRRFGKSLNLDMLRCFLSEPASNHDLFAGLAICKHPEIMRYRGGFPALYMTLKSISNQTTWEDMLQSVRRSISKLYGNYYAEIQSALSSSEDHLVQAYLNLTSTFSDLKVSLLYLTDFLERVHGKKVWILVDEYDAPLTAAAKYDFLQPALDFFRGLFSEALKSNRSLEKAVLTGVTRISKESIVSGLNNVVVYNVLSKAYASAFGFTEEETTQALERAQLSSGMEEVRRWYKGYQFGGRSIYNPWSIALYISQQELAPYWINTGDESILKQLLLRSGEDPIEMNQDLDHLLQKQSITFSFSDNTTFQELEKTRNNILTLLLQSGYLTIADSNQLAQNVTVRIPNEEILLGVKTALFKWIYHMKKNVKAELENAFISANYDAIQKIIRHFSSQLSYYDTATQQKEEKSHPERIYHVFLLGILTALDPLYELDSNIETGYGRADLMLRPRQAQNPGYIIELKLATSSELLAQGADKALEQIRKKDYAQRMRNRGILKLHALGICAYKKDITVHGCIL